MNRTAVAPGPRALFVVPSAYDALVEKGVDGMITERDENGYFSRVVTVHPFTATSRRIELGPRRRPPGLPCGACGVPGSAAG